MKSESAVVIGLGLAAGVGVLLYTRRPQAGDGGSTPAPQDGGAGGAYDPFGGYGGGFAPFDPFTGQAIDPTTGLPANLAAPPLIGLSPQAESAIIEDTRQANDQAVQDNRDSLGRIEDNTRTSNAIQAAVVTASVVPFVVGGALKYGPQLGRAVASAASGLGRSVPAIGRAAVNMVPRLAAPGATIAQAGALTGAGVAAGVAGGAALGLGAVKVLDSTGALDSLQRTSSSIARNTSQPVQTIIKTAAQPLSYVGAVATGIVGHGSVGGNLQKAYQGTVTQKAVSGGIRTIRRLF